MYDIFGFLSILFWPIVIIGIIVFLIRRKHGDKPGMTLHDWKKFGMIVSIAALLAFFIGFFTAVFFASLAATGPFAMMLVLEIAVIVGGILIRTRPAVSYGLVLGGVFNLIYNFGLNVQHLDPSVAVIFIGIALFVMIAIAYKKFQDVEEAK